MEIAWEHTNTGVVLLYGFKGLHIFCLHLCRYFFASYHWIFISFLIFTELGCWLAKMYPARAQDAPQEMEAKLPTAELLACVGSAWVLFSFTPFPFLWGNLHTSTVLFGFFDKFKIGITGACVINISCPTNRPASYIISWFLFRCL